MTSSNILIPEEEDEAAINHGWLRLQQSRTYIKYKHWYFYNTVIGFIPHHMPHLGTLGVTKHMVLGVDMPWFSKLDEKIGAGCLIHEAMHVLRDITRIEAMADQEVAGIAFDLPINDDLRAYGIELPPWVLYSDTFGLPPGLTGEKYYDLLLKKKDQLPKSRSIGSGKCGTCSGVTKGEALPPVPGRSSSEVRYFRSLGIRDLKEHIKKGGFGAGVIPGSMKDFLEIDGTEEAVVDWQQTANSSMSQSLSKIRYGQADYSMKRLSKRSFAVGMPRPGLITQEPTVVFIEDSSGSMGLNEQLKPNRVELGHMMRQLGITEVWFIQADTRVTIQPKRVNIVDFMAMPVVGRGGTNFKLAIEEAMRIQPAPNMIVYSTDGDGPAPKHKPDGVEFIWLLAPGPWTKRPCDWGVQILTSNDRKTRKRYEIIN